MDLEPTAITIEFDDGSMTCMGFASASDDAEIMVADEFSVVEHMKEFEVKVVDDGEVWFEGERHDIEPGTYVVNSRGLWRRVDFDGT